ncbi:TRAP transporter substrate-binding protein DctP [Candidatus Neomarinimicrobiota bacterium]
MMTLQRGMMYCLGHVLPLFLLCLLPVAGFAQPVNNIKIATLAPIGSPWHEVLEDIAQDFRIISNNTVRLTIYAGGVAGDESDMIRKMRLNQLQAVAVSAEGMSYIDKGSYGLSIPLLARNYEELDWIRSQIEPELISRFQANGVEVLSWADIGWVYWFTRRPAPDPEDLRNQRIFNWAGDSYLPRLWRSAGFQSVSLAATDIMPAFQTGMIDAIASSPLTVASFQWFSSARYMTDMPWAAMTGAILIRQDTWESVPTELRARLQAAVDTRALRIKNEIRYSDDDAIAAMREYGLTVVPVSDENRAKWYAIVDQYGRELRGTLIDAEIYDQLMEIKARMNQTGFGAP